MTQAERLVAIPSFCAYILPNERKGYRLGGAGDEYAKAVQTVEGREPLPMDTSMDVSREPQPVPVGDREKGGDADRATGERSGTSDEQRPGEADGNRPAASGAEGDATSDRGRGGDTPEDTGTDGAGRGGSPDRRDGERDDTVERSTEQRDAVRADTGESGEDDRGGDTEQSPAESVDTGITEAIRAQKERKEALTYRKAG